MERRCPLYPKTVPFARNAAKRANSARFASIGDGSRRVEQRLERLERFELGLEPSESLERFKRLE